MTVRETLAEGTALLASSNIDTPALDASLLLAAILGVDRAHLLLAYPDSLPSGVSHRFKELLERRLGGECVAYILGHKEFRNLDFMVNPAVLVPRPDTETLVEAALEFCGKALTLPRAGPGGLRLLDLGTGSGAVAVALKHEVPGLEMWASDISEEALETARANATRLLGPGPAGYTGVRFIKSDLFAHIPGQFHVIISNPPYVPGAEIETLSPEVRREPRLALDGGRDGLDLIRLLISEAPDRLYPGGGLFIEADPRQMTTLAALLETGGLKDIQTYRDLSGKKRVIGAVI
jgi:release factor glutamine methyltransferase